MKNVENNLRDISNKKFDEASEALNVIGSNPIFISKWPRGGIGRHKGGPINGQSPLIGNG